LETLPDNSGRADDGALEASLASSVPCLLATPVMTAATQMMEHDNDDSGTDNGA
jgi:hypothetical protein